MTADQTHGSSAIERIYDNQEAELLPPKAVTRTLSVSFERDEIGPQKVTPCGYQHGPNDNGPQIDAFRQQ
jgi:hypothetical protein